MKSPAVSAEIHELRKLRRRCPLPIPESASGALAAFGCDITPAGKTTFTLRRRRKGVEVWFSYPSSHLASFSWNASAMLDVWPENFAEARCWAKAYAARHGQAIEEVRKPRAKVPAGDDRGLM